VTGVVVPRHRSARISPSVTKTAAGAIEYLTFCDVGGVPAALDVLNKAGVLTVGLAGESRDSIYDLDLGTTPVALVVGGEEKGLSVLTRKRCATVVSIPSGQDQFVERRCRRVRWQLLKWRVNEFDVRSEIQLGTSDPTTFECRCLVLQRKERLQQEFIVTDFQLGDVANRFEQNLLVGVVAAGTTLVRLRAPSPMKDVPCAPCPSVFLSQPVTGCGREFNPQSGTL